jgi:DNA mismatch endonuclease (patch repair protein)
MADILSRAERSERMARVRPHANRTTELAFSEALRQSKVSGWRRHRRLSLGIRQRDGRASGRHAWPDFVFSRERVAVFVDGCFWHACPRHRTMPASNRVFWAEKLQGKGKRARDQ